MKKVKLLVAAFGVLLLTLVVTGVNAQALKPAFQPHVTAGAGISKSNVVLPKDDIAITQSLDTATITVGNSVACNDGVAHTDNSYIRVYDLAVDFSITTDIVVSSVDVGIEQATASDGAQPVQVNLYTTTANPPTFADLTLLSSTDFDYADNAGVVSNFDVTDTTVPANSVLVVEFFTPNGQATGELLFVGSNANGENDPTYLAAADCGVAEPLPTGDLGFPDMALVEIVNAHEGTAGGDNLIANGGFEATDVRATRASVLDPWVSKNAVGDKIKCDTETKIVAFEGVCAWRFKGGVGESTKLQQIVDLTGLTFAAGDVLDLSAQLNANKPTTNGKIKVVVAYSDTTAPDKFKGSFAQTAGYEEQVGSVTLLGSAVSKIKVMYINKSLSGKAYLDAVSLTQTPAAAALVPLPR
jgi:hypothetical protein